MKTISIFCVFLLLALGLQDACANPPIPIVVDYTNHRLTETTVKVPTGAVITFESGSSLVASSGATVNLGSCTLTLPATGLFLSHLDVGGGASVGEFRLLEASGNGVNYTGFKAASALAANTIYTMPSADGTAGQVLKTNGSLTLSWVDPASSSIDNAATFTADRTWALGGHILTIGTVTISAAQFSTGGASLTTDAGAFDAGTGSFSGTLSLGGGVAVAEFRMLEGSGGGANYTGFKSPATLAANVIYEMPGADGSAGQILKTNGSKVLSWVTAAGTGDLLSANNLSDLASAATARTNLGLAIGANVQAYAAPLTTYGSITPSTAVQNILGLASPSATTFVKVNADNTASLRTPTQVVSDLGLVIGTNVQAYDADLVTYAGITPTTVGQHLLALTNPSAITFIKIAADNTISTRTPSQVRTDLGLVVGTDVQAYNAHLTGFAAIDPADVPLIDAANTFTGATNVFTNDLIVAGTLQNSGFLVNTGSAILGTTVAGQVAVSITAPNTPTHHILDITDDASTPVIWVNKDFNLDLNSHSLLNALVDAGEITTGTLAVARGGTGITALGAGIATWWGTPSSANLAAALTDENGSGKAIFAAGTLAITSGKTFTATNTLTLSGTDGTTMTFPGTSATLARTDAANTFTGHQTLEGVTSTGATGTGKFVFDTAPTLSTLTLGTALSAANGGTGLSSSAIGDLLYASASGTLSSLADVATGNALISGGVTTAPSWGKITTAHTTGIAASGANADVTALSALATISTITENALGASQAAIGSTTGVGLLATNTTAATVSVSQATPEIRLSSKGWSTGSTASQDVTWDIGAVTASGSSPSGTLNIRNSINAGAFTSPLTLTGAGALTTLSTITSGAGVFAGAGSMFQWTGRSQMKSAADGTIELENNAGTSFGRLDFGGSTSSFAALSSPAVNGFTIVSGGNTATYNDASTGISGTAALRACLRIDAPTFSSTGTGVTDTEAATVYIGDAPAAGTNTTIGTAYALHVAAGKSSFGGDVLFAKTITAGGTTGAQTINKTSGSVNFAAAATSLVVTNSLVTANSIIQCTVATHDSTMLNVQAVAAAGSFTIYANAAATAETRVNFTVTN